MIRFQTALPIIALLFLSACNRSSPLDMAWVDCSAPDPLGFTSACIRSAEEADCDALLHGRREVILQTYRAPTAALALPASCWSEPGDRLTDLVAQSLEREAISPEAWLTLARNSGDDRIALSILSELLMAGHNSAVELFIQRHKASLGTLDDQAKSLLAWSAQPAAIVALIDAIQRSGYPERRFAMQDLAQKDNEIWQPFLCDYYRQTRSPLRSLFGWGAPEELGLGDRLAELRRVRIDASASPHCSIWF
ncbi:hypothetical protein [Wenzhouxiangella marina]|uniref:Uncharacterized protein n=1 Tax=Wenzhouxiangella marina TaxID=1579979 RepID=A0A0K0XV06_9GAMM|nr:hypothetical protein [Wenzhouxiangella marina]AKS41457.1 hypothetical protein WM2015_1082 [Wenzhouxiangella marina]MBB6086786.1 hypothetical protein [Wenzhouxiangella marina]